MSHVLAILVFTNVGPISPLVDCLMVPAIISSSAPSWGAEYQSMSVSVLSVCLFCLHAYLWQHKSKLHNFLCMLSMSVAWSFSDDAAALCIFGFVDNVMLAHNGGE